MKRLTLFILLTFALSAQSLTYKVKAPLSGAIGEIKVNYYSDSSSYNISASMRTFGLAKRLSGNRLENYSSKGKVKGGKYYAKHFIQDFSYKNKKGHLEYIFNYPAKKIYKARKRWQDGKKTLEYKKPLNYFTYNDLFAIYHNIIQDLKGKPAGWYKVQVAGLERHGGYLKIKIPTASAQKREAEDMGIKNVWIFHIITNKAIMKSKNGEIVFAVGDNGIAKAVRVLDIPFVSHLDAVLQ